MEKQFRFLKYYTAVTTILIGVLLLMVFKQSRENMRLRELTVQRINIVDTAGNVRVQLAGSFPPRRAALAGFLFVNNEGTEAGGLVYSGQKKDGRVSEGATLTMDQYNEDQCMSSKSNGQKSSFLKGYFEQWFVIYCSVSSPSASCV
jgi:hypothetical protein